LGLGRNIVGNDLLPALCENPTQVTPDEARPTYNQYSYSRPLPVRGEKIDDLT